MSSVSLNVMNQFLNYFLSVIGVVRIANQTLYKKKWYFAFKSLTHEQHFEYESISVYMWPTRAKYDNSTLA